MFSLLTGSLRYFLSKWREGDKIPIHVNIQCILCCILYSSFLFSAKPPQCCPNRLVQQQKQLWQYVYMQNSSGMASCSLPVPQDFELLLSLWSSVLSDLPYWSQAVSDWSETVFSVHCHWHDMWICLGPPDVPQFVWNCRFCMSSSDHWGMFYSMWKHTAVSQGAECFGDGIQIQWGCVCVFILVD